MAPDEAHPTAVVTTWPDRTGVPYALFPLLVLVSRLLGPPPADGACALGPPPPPLGWSSTTGAGKCELAAPEWS